MARKGQFKKGGGRVGSGNGKRKARKSTAVATRTRTVVQTRYRNRPKARHHRRRRGGHGGGVNMLHLALATAGMAYATGASGPAFVKTYAAKVPGAATFGIPAVAGLSCLAIDRFVKPNKWLKLAGIAGVVLAATKIGEQGTGFSWVGDEGGEYTGDVGDDDVGDDIDGEDDDIAGDDDY